VLKAAFSVAGMQSAISKINPQVLKSVIASGSVNHGCESGNPIPSKISVSVPSSPALPVYTPPTLRYSDNFTFIFFFLFFLSFFLFLETWNFYIEKKFQAYPREPFRYSTFNDILQRDRLGF
jgi:hypothetical protein